MRYACRWPLPQMADLPTLRAHHKRILWKDAYTCKWIATLSKTKCRKTTDYYFIERLLDCLLVSLLKQSYKFINLGN